MRKPDSNCMDVRICSHRHADIGRGSIHDLIICICLAPGDFNMNRPLADGFMIEIDRWPRDVAPLASHIEVFRRKIEMRVLNSYDYFGSIPKLVGFWIPDIALTTHIHQS